MAPKLLTNELLLTLKTFSGYKYSLDKQKIIYLASQPDLKENKSFKELHIMDDDGTNGKRISEPGANIAESAFVLKGKK
jgi:hypothetical protein